MQRRILTRRTRTRAFRAFGVFLPFLAAILVATGLPATAAPKPAPPAASGQEAQASAADRAARAQRESARTQAAAADPNGLSNLGKPRPRLPGDSQAAKDAAEQEFREACNGIGRAQALTKQGFTRNRFQQCFLGSRTAQLWRRGGTPPPTTPMAEMKFDYSLLVISYDNSRAIDFIFNMDDVVLKGGEPHLQTDLRIWINGCNSNAVQCTPDEVRTNVEWRDNRKHTFRITSPDTAGEGVHKILRSGFDLRMRMVHRMPNVDPWSEDEMTRSVLRFDTAGTALNKSTGTVFPDFVPSYDLLRTSDLTVAETTRHILDAQFHPRRTYPRHPGNTKNVPGYDRPLHRLMDSTKQGQNRNASKLICNELWAGPRSEKDCDEYPWASTQEGASTGVTDPDQPAWHGSARLITNKDNQAAGNHWNIHLYNANRILDNDEFRVRPVDDCETCGPQFPPPYLPRSKDTDRRISGSFIQPDLIDDWTDQQLADEFTMMKSLNMTQLVLQWTANSHDVRENGAKTAIYPNALGGYKLVTKTDVVARTLRAANAAGIDVWVGLQVNDFWWKTYARDQGFLDNEATIARALAKELWSRYGGNKSFRGWYLSFEMDNVNFSGAGDEGRMIGFYQQVVRELRFLTGSKPVAIAPFFNAVNRALPGWKNPQEWGEMWTRMLREIDLDIIALQDGIGAGHGDPTTIHPWYAELHKALRAADALTYLISDTETFKIGASGLQPSSTQEIVEAIRAVEDQTEVFWSFSFNHYQSPRSKFGSQAYLNGYRRWAAIDDRKAPGFDPENPSRPGNLTARADGSQTIHLNWGDSSDGTSGVAGYFIYRDDELVATKISPQGGFTDRQLNPGSLNKYQVRAFDGSGRTSELSNYAEASTEGQKVSQVNYARCGARVDERGCPYLTGKPADSSYPDDGGYELTDGKRGPAQYTPEWQGRNAAGVYSFIINLGQQRTINEITSGWLQVRDDYVFLPAKVTYAVSSTVDGPYTEVPSIDLPAVSARLQTKTYRSVNLNLTGQFVKVTVDGSTAWTMLDEVEIRGD
ncbi:DUF4434 domain-containing protein [Crossiella cryophila]|uniref:Fibronectin type-III domain-containing protein n=1 Tax=Crossiella cryophila TaxID=43355 RepID=A0A7W7CG82_9PSEU|nr:DUF4434 domain-containing protein [Crossiella cryophila]MBB4680651.1 hypothetical protein [Crossiella cryophila]